MQSDLSVILHNGTASQSSFIYQGTKFKSNLPQILKIVNSVDNLNFKLKQKNTFVLNNEDFFLNIFLSFNYFLFFYFL